MSISGLDDTGLSRVGGTGTIATRLGTGISRLHLGDERVSSLSYPFLAVHVGVASSMQVGIEWLIDAAGCSPETLRDPAALQALCARVLDELHLLVVGTGTWHQFPPPGGLTGLYLLTESHLACHTYPECGVVTVNLHCCRNRPRWGWESALRDALGASSVTVREIPRGVSDTSGGAT